ncbi:MAG: hypothetical protein ABL982_08855 [Vicinamibacterales bacterium]
MRRLLNRLAACLVVSIAATGCAGEQPTEYQPTSTVREVMNSIIDPSSDALWDSVEIVATVEGTVHKMPKTDEEWAVLRRSAVTLVEAGNLLLIPGRLVARPGEQAGDPRSDLNPEEIETKRRQVPGAWARRARGLQDSATESLKAIDAKDVTALLNAGETLDAACESCHREYWYRVP